MFFRLGTPECLIILVVLIIVVGLSYRSVCHRTENMS